MKKPELLAPAGNMECLRAAINAGCDAVYLGGYTFGARNYALNFSNEELKEAIEYAHVYGVKVYVTVNTIIYEEETENFLKYIDLLHKNNVDAIIIQDLGMMDAVRRIYPNLEIHASTQMNVHNVEGAKFLEKLGIKRVVLARETSIDIIKEIKDKTNIEVETFIHGALCLSYSGQCLMSSLIGGRSGNRGTCAQCCRMEYDLISNDKKINKDKYLLSTKDLNTLENLDELINCGIESLKIEGRMKRPEYVYLVTSIYRKAIDNIIENKKIITKKDMIELKKIFNRKFTKGFVFNEKNEQIIYQKRPNHVGIHIDKILDINKKIRIKLLEDIHQGDGIRILGKKDIGFVLNKIYVDGKLKNSALKGEIIEIEYKDYVEKNSVIVKTTDKIQMDNIDTLMKKTKKIEITGVLNCRINKKIILTLNDGVNEVEYSYGNVDKAINGGTSIERISNQIKKLNNTPFILSDLQIEADDNIFIKISDINELRRKCVEKLIEKRKYKMEYKKNEYKIEINDYPVEKKYSYLIKTKEQYEKIKNKEIATIYVEKENLSDKRIVPRINRIQNNPKKYDKTVLLSDLGSLNLNHSCITDFNFNVTNSYTVAFLHSLGVKKVTLSYELNDRQIKNIIDSYHKRYNKHPNLELIISSTPEVMVSKFDLLKQYNVTDGYLVDKYKNKFKIISNDNYMTIYHYEKKNLSSDYFNIGINNLRIHID